MFIKTCTKLNKESTVQVSDTTNAEQRFAVDHKKIQALSTR